MKKPIDVLIINKEADINLSKRRENYALKRDLQAMDQNKAITKRLLLEEESRVKCVKCGKEFSAGEGSKDNQNCPECR